MADNKTFNQAVTEHLQTLQQYVPVVDRVHGNSHPEFHTVKRLFDTITEKIQAAGTDRPQLDDEFVKLRETTGGYTVPNDVCETFEAVYRMLAQLDEAYNA